MGTNRLEMPAVEVFGRYEVLGRIAAGGMGSIHLARERAPGGPRLVALKRLLPKHVHKETYVTMFEDEARLASRMNHRCICRVFASGRVGAQPFLAMEWIHGVSLADLVEHGRGRGLPVAVVTRVLAEVASALEYSHQAVDEEGRSLGVVHRDITPPNIMVDFDGRVKLLDFGLAKAVTQEHETDSGYIKGRFRYFAPEQLDEGRDADWRVDIFALGLCGYEGLTGRPLFDHVAPLDVLGAIQRYSGPPSIRAIRRNTPTALEAILHRALARSPAMRFQTVSAFREALDQTLTLVDPSFDDRAMSRFVVGAFPEAASRAGG